ncbi:small multidrug resistance protein [Brucella melitensis]|nr:small multidrug resistance protein [Brucella melitensis]
MGSFLLLAIAMRSLPLGTGLCYMDRDRRGGCIHVGIFLLGEAATFFPRGQRRAYSAGIIGLKLFHIKCKKGGISLPSFNLHNIQRT